MAAASVNALLTAKLRNAKASTAFYSVSSDVDGAKIVQQMGVRSNQAIVAMLASAREPLTKKPQLVAAMLQGVMTGVSRRMLESPAPEKEFDTVRKELVFLASAYVQACSEMPSVP